MKSTPFIQSSDVFGGEIQYFRLDVRHGKPILLKFKEAGLKNVTTSEGGHREYKQPRNLISAVLHEGPKDRILFVPSHYPEAARARITLADASATSLLDFGSGRNLKLQNGSIELDRKSVSVFRVL